MLKRTVTGFPFAPKQIALFFCLSVFVISITTSCNGNNSQANSGADSAAKSDRDTTGRANTSNIAGGALPVSENLYTVYIENNPGKQDLGTLLKNGNTKKLVLQLFRSGSGDINIFLFPFKAGNHEIEPSYVMPATQSSETKGTLPSAVTFGDLQIADVPGGADPVSMLRRHLYSTVPGHQNDYKGWEYIKFTPEIKSVDEGTFKSDYVVFNVTACNVKPGSSDTTSLAKTDLGYANPAPPRKIY